MNRVVPFFDSAAAELAVLIDHTNMEPEIYRGSVALLEAPGYHGDEWIYSVGPALADVRWVTHAANGVRLQCDASPNHALEIPLADLEAVRPRRLAGIIRPYTTEFGDWLRWRFQAAPGDLR